MQQYAFGTDFLALFGDRETVELAAVSRTEPATKMAARFIATLAEEIDHVDEIAADGVRCRKMEQHTFRRCMLCRDHKGVKCKFTSKGSISMSTAVEFIKATTSGEMKEISGLDDIKVLKGHNNWIKVRSITVVKNWHLASMITKS